MKLRTYLSAYYHKLFPPKAKMLPYELLGRQLLLQEGTIDPVDKDDAWFYAMAQQHDVLYDIGANLGYASLLATVQQPGKTIVLAEPNQRALDIAKNNLEVNKLSANKTLIPAFVSDTSNEQLKLYTIGAGAAGSMYKTHAKTAATVNAYQLVPTITLDAIMQQTGIVPGLVKIDVEGAEAKVLQGAANMATLNKVIFFVEMHGPEELPMVKNAALVLEWCSQHKYHAYYLAEHSLLTNEQQLAHRGRCHLLLLPDGKAYPEYLKSIKEGDKIKP